MRIQKMVREDKEGLTPLTSGDSNWPLVEIGGVLSKLAEFSSRAFDGVLLNEYELRTRSSPGALGARARGARVVFC